VANRQERRINEAAEKLRSHPPRAVARRPNREEVVQEEEGDPGGLEEKKEA
jgi:hypothetical protein